MGTNSVIHATYEGDDEELKYLDNPFDLAGKAHNAILDFANGDYDLVNNLNEVNNDSVYLLIEEYLANNMSDSFYLGTHYIYYDTFYAHVKDDYNDYDSDGDTFFQNRLDDLEDGNPMDKTTPDVFENYNATITTLSDLNDFLDYTNDVEDAVIADTNLTSSEKRSLLVAFSISRHSFGYWYDVMNR